MSMLKPYMIYSRYAGQYEGAALVFAHTAKEARKIGWNGIGSDLTGGEYIDLAATLMKNSPWIFGEADVEKFDKDEPHVIDDPRCCTSCEMWGLELFSDGLCQNCRDNLFDKYGG
jgi:hypothetical protein